MQSSPLLEPLDSPEPPPRAPRRAEKRERTDVIPRAGAAQPSPEPDYGGRRRRGVGSQARRVKRTLRHVDPVTVLKLSLMYYLCLVVLWLIGVGVLYAVLSSYGLFDTVEEFVTSFRFEADWALDIDLWLVERWALLIGLTFAVLASIGNVVLAFLYNLSADVVGGVELTFVERDL